MKHKMKWNALQKPKQYPGPFDEQIQILEWS